MRSQRRPRTRTRRRNRVQRVKTRTQKRVRKTKRTRKHARKSKRRSRMRGGADSGEYLNPLSEILDELSEIPDESSTNYQINKRELERIKSEITIRKKLELNGREISKGNMDDLNRKWLLEQGRPVSDYLKVLRDKQRIEQLPAISDYLGLITDTKNLPISDYFLQLLKRKWLLEQKLKVYKEI